MSDLRYARVYLKNGTASDVETYEVPNIIEMFSDFIASGQDRLVQLDTNCGTVWHIRISHISDIFVFTPESRENIARISKEIRDEKKARGWDDEE